MTTFSYTPINNGDTSDVAHVNTPFTSLANIINGGIEADNLAANSVGASELANNAVDTAAIVDDAVTVGKILQGSNGAILKSAAGATAWSAVGGNGALLYNNGSDVLWTDTPSDGEMLRAVGSVPTWVAVPACRAFHSANQSLTNNTLTALNLDSERFDTDVIHDLVTNNTRLTCKTAGIYAINGNMQFNSSGTGRRSIGIRLNGTTMIAQIDPQPTTIDMPVQIACHYQLAVNDYVEFMALQNSGGALDSEAVANYAPEFSMVRVG